MPNHGESACQLGSAYAMNPNDLVFGWSNIYMYFILNEFYDK